MIELFTYGFMQRALVTGSLVAIACSILGIFLILRRYALIGEGLAHVSFTGIALAFLTGWMPLPVTLAVTIIGALAIQQLTRRGIKGDATIGITYTSIFAIGLLFVSMSNRINVDLFSYLFGNILAISTTDLVLSSILVLLVLGITALTYRELQALCLDEESAKISGLPVNALDTLLLVLTAVTVVLATRVVGILLVTAFLIIPASAALNLGKGFKMTILIGAFIGLVSSILGITLAAIFDLAPSATIVLTNTLFFLVTLFRRP